MEFEIALTDLRFHAGHGVWEQENVIGNEFIVNVKLRIPYSDEIASDNLEATISYADVFSIVEKEMMKPRKLLETVAVSIKKELTSKWPRILSGSISICKSTPPIAGILGKSEVTLFF